MNIKIQHSISVENVNFIRESVGFRQNHPEQIECSINGSSLIIIARTLVTLVVS